MRKVQRTKGISFYKGGSFPALDEMSVALLECPDYLDELPIYRDPEEIVTVEDIRARLASFPAADVERMMARKRRRNNESTTEYAIRIAELLEKKATREQRKDSWAERLFGKKN